MAGSIPGFNEPFPSRDQIAKPDLTASDALMIWVEQSLQTRIQASAYRVPSISPMTNVQGSGAGVLVANATAGQYRISAYREVEVADPVSSSLAITIGFTHGTKALIRQLSAFAGAPQTINDNAGDTVVIDVDAGTPISFTLVYASNTPALARFYVSLTPELVQAEQ